MVFMRSPSKRELSNFTTSNKLRRRKISERRKCASVFQSRSMK